MDDNKINIIDPEIIGEPILSSDSEITVDAVAIEELRQTTTEIVSEGLETEIDRKENVEEIPIETLEEKALRQEEEQKERARREAEDKEQVRIAAEEAALKAAIAEQAREDEQPSSANFTLKKIIGGDILYAQL